MSQSKGKHIRLFLVDGVPNGIITAEVIMGWTGKVLSFPRGLLPQAQKRPECSKTGIYFLTGFDDEQRPLVYIGEAENVAERLTTHDKDEDKAFFEQVTMVISQDENLTKSHIRYLEKRLIERAKQNGTRLKNANEGYETTLPEAEQSDMEYLIEQLSLVLPLLGLDFLKPLPPPKTQVKLPQNADDAEVVNTAVTFELSYLNGQVSATAYEANGEFIVEQGAIIRNMRAPTYDVKVKVGERYLQRYAAQYQHTQPTGHTDECLLLQQPVAFKSPSGAAKFVCGASVNGNLLWKLKDTQQTYGEWRQKQLEQV
jgi:predicted GIY-YIG superfamily endonuclease